MKKLSVVFLLLAGCETTAQGPAPTAADRRFLIVEGSVSINKQPAAVGTAIPEKADIVVAANSRAVITIQDGSAIELRAGSKLNLAPSARKKTSVKILAGVVWSILPVGKADYEVVTDNAVAGIRGTTIFTDTSTPGTTILCVCQGEVDLEPGTAKPQRLATTAHEHTVYFITGTGKDTTVELKAQAVEGPGHPNAVREQLRKLATK